MRCSDHIVDSKTIKGLQSSAHFNDFSELNNIPFHCGEIKLNKNSSIEFLNDGF